MGSAIASVTLYLAFSGAVLRYLVWEFWNRPGHLQQQYSTRARDSTEKISAERFLPSVVKVVEAVESRRKVSGGMHITVMEVLSEVELARGLQEVKRASVDEEQVRQGFRRLQTSCSHVCAASLALWAAVSLVWLPLLFGLAPRAEFIWCCVTVALTALASLVYAGVAHKRRERDFLDRVNL